MIEVVQADRPVRPVRPSRRGGLVRARRALLVAAVLAGLLATVPVGAREVPFGAGFIVKDDLLAFEVLAAGDFDNDGAVDLVSDGGRSFNRSLVWHRNLLGDEADPAGKSPTYRQQRVNQTSLPLVDVGAVAVGDLNGDGFDDIVLSFGQPATALLLFFNLGDQAAQTRQFREPRLRQGLDFVIVGEDVRGIDLADVDGDGDLDIVVAAGNSVRWVRNADPAYPVITVATDMFGASDVVAVDFDGDDDVDIVASGADGDKIGWFESDLDTRTPPADPLFVQTVASEDPDGPTVFDGMGMVIGGAQQGPADGVTDIAVADADSDGDMDIAFAAPNNDAVGWLLNQGGSFTASLLTADPDGDEATGGGPAEGIADGVASIGAADLDDDGDVDVFYAAPVGDRVAWFDNDGLDPPSFEDRVVSIDPDGTELVTETVFSDVTPEPEGIPRHLERVEIVSGGSLRGVVASPRTVFGLDADGDGDVDLFTTGADDERIVFFENGTCDTVFPVQSPIADGLTDGLSDMVVVDVDQDGDLDVVAASAEEGTVTWHENDGATIPTFTENLIATNFPGVRAVTAGDLDEDGDIDVVTSLPGGPASGELILFDRTGPTEWTEVVLATGIPGIRDIELADMDVDGDIDIVTVSSAESSLSWWRNDGQNVFKRDVISRENVGAWSLAVVDVTFDGRPEIITADFGLAAVAAFVNIEPNFGAEEDPNGDPGGEGEDPTIDPDPNRPIFFRVQLTGDSQNNPTTALFGAADVRAADLDSDGDLDIVAVSAFDDTVVWFEVSPPAPNPVPGLPAQPRIETIELSVDPDGPTSYTLVPVPATDGFGSCDDDAMRSCCIPTGNPGDPEQCPNNNQAVGCAFECDLGTNGVCEFLSEKPCQVESCIIAPGNQDGTCALSGLTCRQDAECANLQCGDLGRCIIGGDCRLNPNDPNSPIEGSCELEDCIVADGATVGSCALSGDSCVTSDDCSQSQCDFGTCEPFDDFVRNETGGGLEGVIDGPTSLDVADLDLDGDLDIVVASTVGDRIMWLENDGRLNPSFQARVLGDANGGRVVRAADINADGRPDVVAGSFTDDSIRWFLGAIDDPCTTFDVNADGMLDGAELAWLGRAFGSMESPTDDGEAAWWTGVDYTGDGQIDGSDLSLLGASEVWGRSVLTCAATCPVTD